MAARGSSPFVDAACDEATLRFYADQAQAYVAGGSGGPSRHLDAFLRGLAAGARILELGCGGGRDSEEILTRGFQLDATDGVPEIARKAEERIGRPVRVMRFDELDATAEYDAVWAHAALLHVPRPALSSILSLVFRALKPGGVHFASFKGGDGGGRDAFGRYFNYLTVDDVRAAYSRAAAWEIQSITEHPGGAYGGGQERWIGITASRPGQSTLPSE